jgi:hypothetical protein
MNINFPRILLILITISSCSLALALDYDTSSREDARRLEVQQEREKAEAEANKMVGKTFWYVPNPKATSRIIFHPTSPTNPNFTVNEQLWKDQFKPASETTFEITGVKVLEDIRYSMLDRYYFEVKFPDGKIGYTQSKPGTTYDSQGLEGHIYRGSRDFQFDNNEYIYAEPPQVIAAREMKEKEKEKKASADARAKWKAKGGVRVGMTINQVLASNWGKPNKVNRSTNKYGVREQWVYEDSNYLYFENGILTSIQN